MTKNFIFQKFEPSDLLNFTSMREGETKLGQVIHTHPELETTKYVILGICESIGPQSNWGFSGAENGFNAFLKRFLNMQSNRFLNGKNVAIAGQIKQQVQFTTVENGRTLLEELDALVFETVMPFMSKGKIPIVIGGGHNNAFALIKAASIAKNETVAVINLDPHADCRPFEGRHSGNPFSYAFAQKHLSSYTVLGLHKSYNSEYLLQFMDDHQFRYTFFDDYILNPNNFRLDIEHACEKLENQQNIGLELDMDSIQLMPSSAFTPSGIRIEQARQYLQLTAQLNGISYLHLPEAAPMTETEEKIVGKALAYLVWDFIHTHSKNSFD